MFTLRSATADDAGAINSLVIAGRINPTGLKWQRFVVAVTLDEEMIGCGQVKLHRDGSRELASIVVSPEVRGQGVARAIIEHLLASHSSDIYLMCRASLGPLYEKFDFQAIQQAEMPRYFRRVSRLAGLLDVLREEGESLLVMKRDAVLED